MKKFHYIFIILMSIVSFFTLQSEINNVTYDPLWNSCAKSGCHSSSTATIVTSITLTDPSTSLPVLEYEPGKLYTLLMTGTNISLSKFGFQLRETNNLGTFSNFPAGTGLQSRGYVTQSTRLNKANSIFSVQLSWTAPAKGSGTVTFDGLINAVNGIGSSGDAVSAVKSFSFTEKVVFALTCSSINTSGSLTSGTAASGVSFSVPYTGATSGASYTAVNSTSTGVTGLTATLSAGTYSGTTGNLTFNVTGTPSGTGTASFAFTVNGASCTHTINVSAANNLALTCANTTSTGTLKQNTAASGVAFTLPYTGATVGSTYSAVNALSNGVTGLTATLSAGSFSAASGNLTLNVTGTPTSSGTASFLVNIAGKSCTLTKAVSANSSILSNESNPISISYQNNLLTIQGDQANKINDLTAYDLNGKVVYNQEIHTNAQKLVLNNLHLNKSIYILQIKMNDGTTTSKKFVIQ